MVAAGLFLALFLAFVNVNAVTTDLVELERIDAPPEGFVNNGPAPGSQQLDLRIALVSKDITGLEKALYDVSDPESELYGQHLTKDDAEAYVSPTPETVSAVEGWLSSNGLISEVLSSAGDWIRIKVPVSKANEMFRANFTIFTNQETGNNATQTLSYSIPASLQGHVELVHPTITFPVEFNVPRFTTPLVSTVSNMTIDAIPSSCRSIITPACLQALYGIPSTRATQASNTLGVTGFIQQFAQNADLQAFLRALRPDLVGDTFTLQTLNGGSNPQDPNEAGVEANLDTQYTIGVASGVPTRFISVGPNNTDSDLFGFLDVVNALLAESAPPHVLTTSYGANENEISKALTIKLCNAYMHLGVRGTSILFSSGDGGVAGGRPGVNRCPNGVFIPTFPSGCPFMTSVGATTGIPETSAYFSSGGFSNYFSTPSYQKLAVPTYLLTLGGTYSGKFNRNGRGFPDIAAQGENVEIVSGGQTGTVGGTSCSSPIFASIIALINDLRIAAGKRPLGFLNPFLYSPVGRKAFNDITTGSNPGCDTNGFPATRGWDPVTGLGTPKFSALLAAAGI